VPFLGSFLKLSNYNILKQGIFRLKSNKKTAIFQNKKPTTIKSQQQKANSKKQKANCQ
jgi:hypothetical protein